MLVSIMASFFILTPLTLSVPQSPCRRCCDDDFLPDEASTTLPPDTPVMPEIHTYINMTILKGSLTISAWELSLVGCANRLVCVCESVEPAGGEGGGDTDVLWKRA